MKRAFSFLLITIIALTLLLTACSSETVCTPCIDSDSDSVCDRCGAEISEIVCGPCVDTDSDLICDGCGAEISEIVCGPCVDTDSDLICDGCGAELVLDVATVSSISVTTPPTRLEYYTGETFDPSGIIVTATDLEGESFEVSDYALGMPATLDSSVEVIFIYYGGRVLPIEINVSEIALTSVSDAKRASNGDVMLVEGFYVGEVNGGFLVKDVALDTLLEVRGDYPVISAGDRIRFVSTLCKDSAVYLEYSSENSTSPVVATDEAVTSPFATVTGVASWDRMTRVFKESSVKVGTYYKIYADRIYVSVGDNGDVVVHLNQDATDLSSAKPDGTRTVTVKGGSAGAERLAELVGVNGSSMPGKCFSGTLYAILLGCDSDSYDLAVLDTSWIELSSVVTPEHEALREVAYAFYYKGNYIHYDQYGTRRNINPSPEMATAEDRLHLDCSSFVNAVYYEAFGENISPFPTTVVSPQTGKLTDYAREYNGINSDVVGYWELSELDTQEKKDAFIEMIRSTLEIGDVIVNRRTSNTGHAIIYVGNGYFLHSTGASYEYSIGDPHSAYDQADGGETKGGTISKLSLSTVLGDKDSGRYILAPNNVTISIFRPLARGLEITDTTASRLTMPFVTIEKSSNVGNKSAVYQGSAIIYNVTIRNRGENDVNELLFTDYIPEGTEYIGGARGILVEDGVLTYSQTLKAGATINVTYAVKVTAESGTIETSGNVNGVPLNVLFNTVSTVSEVDTSTLLTFAENFSEEGRSFADPLELAKALYFEALGIEFTSSETALALIESLIKSEGKTFNSESTDLDILVKSLYGGYDIRSGYFTDNERTRLVVESYLSVGDVIVGEYGDDAVCEVYIYLGDGRFLYATSSECSASIYTIEESAYKNLLVSLISFDRYVIVRPSQK